MGEEGIITMYNIGPLDRLNRWWQQVSSQGSYWLGRVQRLIPGMGSNLPEMPADARGSILFPIAIAGCLLVCCCLAVAALAIGYYLVAMR